VVNGSYFRILGHSFELILRDKLSLAFKKSLNIHEWFLTAKGLFTTKFKGVTLVMWPYDFMNGFFASRPTFIGVVHK